MAPPPPRAPRPPVVRRPPEPAPPPALRAEPEAVANPALLASVFLFAASGLLTDTPMQLGFEPQREVTVALLIVAGALFGLGDFRPHRLLLAAGVLALLALNVACLTTQPIQFGTSLAAAWAVRVALVSLIAIAWALLMDPPAWLRRGLVAAAVPTALLLVVVGGPSVIAQVTGGTPPGN